MKNIIICSDDYGQQHAISHGIIELIKEQRISAVSCLVTSPFWAEHANWLFPYKDKIDIGLHFNLTEDFSERYLNTNGAHLQFPLSNLILQCYTKRINQTNIEAEFNKQIDLFSAYLNKLPDFIDGHQHIHQLPIIRDAILNVYRKRFIMHKPYIRVSMQQNNFSFKSIIIAMLGAHKLKSLLNKYNIPYNTKFSGIYDFKNASNYIKFFPWFLKGLTNNSLIMCHPGLESSDTLDPIHNVRYYEYEYLSSPTFLKDCAAANVNVARFQHDK